MHRPLIELFEQHEDKLSILIVEDEVMILDLLIEMLKRYFAKVDSSTNGRDALALYKAHHHDIVLTDISLPGINGIELSETIKESHHDQPIIVASAHDSAENLFKLINIGVSNFILKPIDKEKLLESIYKVAQKIYLERDNVRYATTDILTGLYNRKKFNELAAHEMRKAKRYGQPLCLILFDIDRFKHINDTYGHLRGDVVLKQIAEIANDALRTVDIIARWGGEEFVILLPDTPIEGAQLVAERIRATIHETRFEECGQLSCSFGVAHFREEEEINLFIKRADDRLYAAKRAGRNRVVHEGYDE